MAYLRFKNRAVKEDAIVSIDFEAGKPAGSQIVIHMSNGDSHSIAKAANIKAFTAAFTMTANGYLRNHSFPGVMCV